MPAVKILTWAVARGTLVSGRNAWHWAGTLVTEQWVWQEVWTLRPALVRSLVTPCSDQAGWEGEQRTTMSAVLPPGTCNVKHLTKIFI